MRIRGLRTLRRIARRIKKGPGRKALILLYHRVADVSSDPWSLCVTPQRFAEHLEVLQKHTQPVPLQQLVQALHSGHLQDKTVVVTFDDGYVDNLLNAKPLLERYTIPATVFLSTGYIGNTREFWWDELDRLLLQPGILPNKLSLKINGDVCQYELGESSKYTEEAFRRYRYWTAWGEDIPSMRHSLYRSLYHQLHPLPEKEQQSVLNELLIWAGAEPVSRHTYRPLSYHEVHALVQGGIIEVGAHTVTHPILSVLSSDNQQDEIRQSKNDIERVLGCSPVSFAYPYGRECDYTAGTSGIVREAGFHCACSNFFSVVRQDTDYFQLPRIQMKDWSGKEFSRHLSEWFAL
ncbi:MAG: polysaccharide deacetylase family protein [wastewater metagenome]|nr:polysaccharide deacetylase family protein [Candidatus Loosdrechtia aerotolerans]